MRRQEEGAWWWLLRTGWWEEEKGGWEILFKIACIYLTQLRTRENDDLGVVHGVAA